MNNYIVLVKRNKFLVYKFVIKLYTNSSVLCSVLIFFFHKLFAAHFHNKMLLLLVALQDSRIAVKACEGLMLCASLPEDHAATVIILYTPFCEVMVSS